MPATRAVVYCYTATACTYLPYAGPSEAEWLGRPEPPHFSWQNFVIIARVHSLLWGATPH